MLVRKIFGISLYFLGIGLWFIIAIFAIIFALPTGFLIFLAGYFTNAFFQRSAWPEFQYWTIWKWLRKHYFGFEEHNFPSIKGPVIWAIYPHGHYSITAVLYWALNPKRFPNTVGAIHGAIFYLPFFGSLANWIGAIAVDEEEMITTLESGKSIFMCPGGVADIENTGTTIIERRGFLRVAQRAGVPVVPVWCSKERNYYNQWLPFGKTLKNWLFFPIGLVIWGVWWCPLLPMRPSNGTSPIKFAQPVMWTKGKLLEEAEREYYEKLRELM